MDGYHCKEGETVIAILESWRDRKTPAEEAADLLDVVTGSEITSSGRMAAWVGRAKKLPAGLRIWLIQKIRERVSDQAADYLAGYLMRQGGRP